MRDNVIAWLEDVANQRRTAEVHLDPFATSMRNFDDVSPNLLAIKAGGRPAVSDPGQRITDLRNAGLIAADGGSLTKLGTAVLDSWTKYGVASNAIGDEFARLLLMVLEGRHLADTEIPGFLTYWQDLRTHFDPLELIDNWDSLYAINYLDVARNGFTPGDSYRDEGVIASDIEFDLLEYANSTGAGSTAVAGGTKVENAIGSKVPRGRHRATFCMALEIVASAGGSAAPILARFGVPERPRQWDRFTQLQKEKIEKIIADYGIVAAAPALAASQATAATPAAAPTATTTAPVVVTDGTPPTLPESIDFSKVLVASPTPKPVAAAAGTKGFAPKKIDHKRKAIANAEVGSLAEDFALAYEKWRLRDHPDLLKKLRQVSNDDDTLGYDIESFELDGSPRFVEVKGTLGPLETRFFLTANEIACAEKHGGAYLILRAGYLAEKPQCCELRYPFDNLELTPATYSVLFKPAAGTGSTMTAS